MEKLRSYPDPSTVSEDDVTIQKLARPRGVLFCRRRWAVWQGTPDTGQNKKLVTGNYQQEQWNNCWWTWQRMMSKTRLEYRNE